MLCLSRLTRLPFTLSRSFTVLALESSADDTCAAVVNDSHRILSNVVMKQNDLHEVYGGIHPEVAIQAHQRNMPLAVQQALKDANVDIVKDIDGVAFTRGPGIGGCLSVGSNAAKSLAAALNKPLVGVHHMQAHALTSLLTSWPNPPSFPFLTLLVSGGHTLLLLAISSRSFKILATTLDESVGRSFDKVSRMLGLKWTSLGPGAALEQFCLENFSDNDSVLSEHATVFPRPMPGRLAFSYASLHSHVERYLFSRGGIKQLNVETRRIIARAFQEAAVSQLIDKLLLGLKWCQNNNITITTIVVSGGVASNLYLRERCVLASDRFHGVDFVYPPLHLCTDNAVMIGWASMTRFLAQDHDDYTIDLLPKWSIEDL
ncbi:hypothetical protein AMATHDRAFT_141146 [Amanita thiersii Skay4041]|uniref:N(6)-L-threonylcarbamoyladenine synthase n=1 Tax=Amanita thiersii Skay4041 TaxID=703135 RepID=A0A2A9NN81_9AGAR|nr:hypothetical protein AMATHDRAFT_141146 [Amanita thiersii Skay4041]